MRNEKEVGRKWMAMAAAALLMVVLLDPGAVAQSRGRHWKMKYAAGAEALEAGTEVTAVIGAAGIELLGKHGVELTIPLAGITGLGSEVKTDREASQKMEKGMNDFFSDLHKSNDPILGVTVAPVVGGIGGLILGFTKAFEPNARFATLTWVEGDQVKEASFKLSDADAAGFLSDVRKAQAKASQMQKRSSESAPQEKTL